jgi:hypothetical protein
MESRARFKNKRLVRQFNNYLLEITFEYVGLENSLKTIVKVNSNFKELVEYI